MFKCVVCHGADSREELVDEVFEVDGRHLRVDGVPSTVCRRCGERSFSRQTTERVRHLVHGSASATRTVAMPVYEFAPGR